MTEAGSDAMAEDLAGTQWIELRYIEMKSEVTLSGV